MIVCINGKFVNDSEAKISVFDHGLLYGDGVFDTIAAMNGKIFWLEEHINRLFDGCETLGINNPWSKQEITNLTIETFKKNNKKKGRIRVMITRGEKDIPIYCSEECRPNLIIFSTELDLPEDKIYSEGIRLTAVNGIRIFPNVKNLNFLPSVMGCLHAKKTGYDDCVFVGSNNEITEGATFNIFMIKNKEIITPGENILKGITADKVIGMAKDLNFKTFASKVKLKKLKAANEIFITGTTKKIIPVVVVDEAKINNGKVGDITKELMNKFSELYF